MYVSTMNRSKLTIRAYIRAMPGMSEARQRARAAEAGATVFYGEGERAAWLRALRPGQAGWVWRLSWLAVAARNGGKLPSADYARTVAILSRRVGEGALVILGDEGIDSDDREGWEQAVEDGALQVRSGRYITSREAARRGKIGGDVRRERAAINLLRTSHKGKLPMVRAYWRSADFPNREAKAEAINAELEAAGLMRLGSWQTIWRALKKLEGVR